MSRKTFPIKTLAAGDTVELLTGADCGFRGIVDQVDAGSAWVMFASDGEDTRKIALADLKITHQGRGAENGAPTAPLLHRIDPLEDVMTPEEFKDNWIAGRKPWRPLSSAALNITTAWPLFTSARVMAGVGGRRSNSGVKQS